MTYIERDGLVVKVSDVEEWAEWMKAANRVVAQDDLEEAGVLVSTVFLGIDHNFGGGGGQPLLYETAVFRQNDDIGDTSLELELRRYPNREAAFSGHREVLAHYKKG